MQHEYHIVVPSRMFSSKITNQIGRGKGYRQSCKELIYRLRKNYTQMTPQNCERRGLQQEVKTVI